MKFNLDTHLLGIVVDPQSFVPWMVWLDRNTGEGTRVAEMLPISNDDPKPSIDEVAEREALLAAELGFSAEEARELYRMSRNDPDYDSVVQKWVAWEREKTKPF